MEALNIRAEYRKAFPQSTITPSEDSLIKWADAKVQFDGWVEDDGDYYTREEWDAEEREAEEYEQQALRDQEEYEREEWAREQQAEYDDYWRTGH